jgi:hypothetical protein
MAKLQSDNLILEIKFKPFEYEWINYDIKFYWKDDIIINDSILKKEGEYWGKRSYGTFIANDYEKDHLIETIRKVLNTNKPEYWEPLEPDAKIAIYPDAFFPFLKDHWILIDEKDDEIRQDKSEKQDENQKQEKDKNTDDLFTVIIFIDSYQFKDNTAYSGEGISLHMIVNRSHLEKFATDLEIEYNNIEKKHIV